jgi:hypothetical protein
VRCGRCGGNKIDDSQLERSQVTYYATNDTRPKAWLEVFCSLTQKREGWPRAARPMTNALETGKSCIHEWKLVGD